MNKFQDHFSLIQTSNSNFSTQIEQKQSRKKKNRAQLVWNDQQNHTYVEFLKSHKQLLKTQRTRRSSKVFDKLSKTLTNRSANQCRTHHKKMTHSYKNINRIIKYLESKINKSLFRHNDSRNANQFQQNEQSLIPKTKNFQNQASQMMQDGCEDKDIWSIINSMFWTNQ